jgi:hypothetical protein
MPCTQRHDGVSTAAHDIEGEGAAGGSRHTLGEERCGAKISTVFVKKSVSYSALSHGAFAVCLGGALLVIIISFG